VEPQLNHHEWEEHAVRAEKLALQLTEFNRLPIREETRARSPNRSPRLRTASTMGASGKFGVSPGGPLSLSRLGTSQSGSMGSRGLGLQESRDMRGLSGSNSHLPYPQSFDQSQHAQFGVFSGGMGLNPASSFVGAGGLGASRDGSAIGALPSPFSIPGLPGDGLQTSFLKNSGLAGGDSRVGLVTPGGTALGSLGPSAAALLAKFGYSSVISSSGPPLGGSAVPSGLGPTVGEYPRVANS